MTLLTVAETSEMLRCSTSMVYKLAAQGQLRVCRIGSGIRVPVHLIEAFLEAQLATNADKQTISAPAEGSS